MTPAAYIAHVLDPLIDPRFAAQDTSYEKTFRRLQDDSRRDYLRGFKRVNTYAVDWAGDNLLLATKDSALRLWDPVQHNELHVWAGEWMSMACSPDNPHVAAAISWTGRLGILDTRVKSFVQDVDLRKNSANMKEFLFLCLSSRCVALNNRSDQVFVLDTRQLDLVHSLSMQQEVNQMAWANDDLWIATGGSPGKLHVYPPSFEPAVTTAHQYAALSLATDPAGRQIASGGSDCLVALWDPSHLTCVRTFGFATQAVTGLSFNKDGDLLAWGTGSYGSSGERNLTIVGARTGNMYWQDTTAATVQQVKWHPKRNVLAYTLHATQLEEQRERRRENAVVHLLALPE